jgi:hypothetical protein
MRAAALLLLLPPLALAQSPRPEDLGTVTGHITCSDTQRPGRLAQVRLVPVTPTLDNGFINAAGDQLPAVWTDMSGGYTIRNVHPGQYYLRVDLSGYVTPLVDFTDEQIEKPTPKDQQRIQQELQLVTIAPHATLHADATLQRSASISGTIVYDDGSPAIGIYVRLTHRDKGGKFREGRYGAMTDPRGLYQIESVPPGDYIVEANLQLSDQADSTVPLPDGKTIQTAIVTIRFVLPVYSGSVTRQKDAAVIEADPGHDTTGADITIPLSQLHEISGSLLAKDGHAINAGTVELLFADDRSHFADVTISSDDNQFHFPYVPEGNYIITVEEAKDVSHIEVPNVPGATPRTRTEDRTLRTYGPLEQPLTVQTDIQSLTLTVPDTPPTPLTSSAGTTDQMNLVIPGTTP